MGPIHDGVRFLRARQGAKVHGSETKTTDGESGTTEVGVLHADSLAADRVGSDSAATPADYVAVSWTLGNVDAGITMSLHGFLAVSSNLP